VRGVDEQTGALFSYLSPEALVPKDHPLRAIRRLVNAALEQLSAEFAVLYASGGRPSIAPEKLLGALLPQAFYGVRSERQLMEPVTYNLLFRVLCGLTVRTRSSQPAIPCFLNSRGLENFDERS
jgi:transposase